MDQCCTDLLAQVSRYLYFNIFESKGKSEGGRGLGLVKRITINNVRHINVPEVGIDSKQLGKEPLKKQWRIQTLR